MNKRLARWLMAEGCRVTCALSRAERNIGGRLTILCYHRVLPEPEKRNYFQPDLVVTPEVFRVHMHALSSRYTVLPLGRAVEEIRSSAVSNRPLAAVTFDDGYFDNYRYAASILTEAGVKGTFFVISDLVGTDRLPWYDRLGQGLRIGFAAVTDSTRRAALQSILEKFGGLYHDLTGGASPATVVELAKRLTPTQRSAVVEQLGVLVGAVEGVCPGDRMMNWSELHELIASGHEVGSHTRTHPILPQLSRTELMDEIAGSRRVLEEGLACPVGSFCYPNGDYDERVERAVADTGYSCAVTVEPGVNTAAENVYRLRRWFVHQDRLAGRFGQPSDTLLRMEVCGLADRVFRRNRSAVTGI